MSESTQPIVDRAHLAILWHQALQEDGADLDVTTRVAFDRPMAGTAHLNARQPGVFAGRALLDMLADAHPEQLKVNARLADGDRIHPTTPIAVLNGPLPLLLGIERTLLNFLERLCGVATLTRRFVDAVAGTKARIYDTRKTIPGWRLLDKYAVRCGGGFNHRIGLHDAVLIKDNHLTGVAVAGLAAAAGRVVDRCRQLDPRPDFIEFEVDTLGQLDELLKVPGIDVILVDNFSPKQIQEAVRRRNASGPAGRTQLEASGGVNLETVREIAATGVERIAVGAITHSAPALDIGMDITVR
ncbi:MAG: carboxylating nicotinate-nucleotide diphosphorylase [Phycisphaerae bacterium]|nr:carboxylating nicotinate-nucleotide diphosphorylase [Phycisphaerae bacterium]